MAYKHGKNGRVILGGATLKVTEWDGDDEVDDVFADNTEAGGYQEMMDGGGIARMNGSVTAILVDGTPPPVRPGVIAPLELYEGGKTASYAYKFNAYIGQFKRHNVVKSTDPIMFTFSYKSSGAFTATPTS